MNVVLDTNVLVSALWSPGNKPSTILANCYSNRFTPCYDYRILGEYARVLHYREFRFSELEINALLDPIIYNGLSVVANPILDVSFDKDATDRKFYEVAKYCDAILITGNLAHYPSDPDILSPAEFYRRYL